MGVELKLLLRTRPAREMYASRMRDACTARRENRHSGPSALLTLSFSHQSYLTTHIQEHGLYEQANSRPSRRLRRLYP
jgi:hypothetical protein